MQEDGNFFLSVLTFSDNVELEFLMELVLCDKPGAHFYLLMSNFLLHWNLSLKTKLIFEHLHLELCYCNLLS